MNGGIETYVLWQLHRNLFIFITTLVTQCLTHNKGSINVDRVRNKGEEKSEEEKIKTKAHLDPFSFIRASC